MKVIYPAANVVSVWIGSFASEDDFDDCIIGPLEEALGLEVELASICEFSFEDAPVDVRKLLEGFSGWEAFIDAAAANAKARGVQRANAALVCYGLKCEGAPAPGSPAAKAAWGGMEFLGSF